MMRKLKVVDTNGEVGMLGGWYDIQKNKEKLSLLFEGTKTHKLARSSCISRPIHGGIKTPEDDDGCDVRGEVLRRL